MATFLQDEVHLASLKDPESFWSRQAQQLHWHRHPSRALRQQTKRLKSGKSHDHWSWFPDGEISTCYNCVDRHVFNGHGDAPAILYDSPVTMTKQRITYAELLAEVETFAGVLQQEGGVKKGDVVIVYMPMVPAALIGILAINRIGALHAVVFGGFAAPALAQRIEASRPVVILTASCGIDGNKPPTSYRPFVEEAIALSKWKPPRVIIWQREESSWHPIRKTAGERSWQNLVKSAKARKVKAECVPVKSNDGIYVIYTSGTTGKPKGVLRESAGHAVGLALTSKYIFGIQGPGDVMGCLSDIGWVVSHSYTLYGPLLVGAATVLYEGKPVGTPDASAFWRLVSEYKVNSMFTAPTALRAIRKDDPDNTAISTIGDQGGLRSLKALFVAGERSEPALITMYQGLLKKYGANDARVIDNWWSSESGSPITAIALAPQVARLDPRQGAGQAGESSARVPTVKPGTAGKPMPGFDVRIVNDAGDEVKRGEMGNIVLALPLPPTAFSTLWDDEERFYVSYLRRFHGRWVDTGDAGMVDSDGYVSIMARSDDIINVAAHRLSTGSLEQAVTSHPLVTEACVVGIPDELKGQMPFAFVGVSVDADREKLFTEVQELVRSQVGRIASLGGMIVGKGMIPKTRSGKTLRRVLRELLENAVHGDFDKNVNVPSTVEDISVVEVAREEVRRYFRESGDKHRSIETKSKL